MRSDRAYKFAYKKDAALSDTEMYAVQPLEK